MKYNVKTTYGQGNDQALTIAREISSLPLMETDDVQFDYDILEECRYKNLNSARFNLTDFDIEVNGGKSATKHGKRRKGDVAQWQGK